MATVAILLACEASVLDALDAFRCFLAQESSAKLHLAFLRKTYSAHLWIIPDFEALNSFRESPEISLIADLVCSFQVTSVWLRLFIVCTKNGYHF